MPGDEQKSMNRAENHARLTIISWSMSPQTTDTNYYNAEMDKKIPKCLSCADSLSTLTLI